MTELIQRLKDAGQDHEFYPTTVEIITATLKDFESIQYSKLEGVKDRWGFDQHYEHHKNESILDVGAGNGKVLRAFKRVGTDEHGSRRAWRSLYAIEKSPILCDQLDDDIIVVGTDLFEQSLLSKEVDVIFSNPPYSEFEAWAVKIIRESAAKLVYLVIPVRWRDNKAIQETLKFRDAIATAVGEFDFADAEDRTARARVHLVRIVIAQRKGDAFEAFFNAEFGNLKQRWKEGEGRGKDDKQPANAKQMRELVVGPSYPEAMVNLYLSEMDLIRRNYSAIGTLEVGLLKEFELDPSKIMSGLKQRLKGLRNVYWNELFNRLDAVTNRLTSKKRRQAMDGLQRHAEIDFTLGNIHVIVLWLIRHANQFIDEQLIDVFEDMATKANIHCYKSNQRVFSDDRWRFRQEKPTHVYLDYRIVATSCGGIGSDYGSRRGLNDVGCRFLGDLLTVANNLGFLCKTTDSRLDCHWSHDVNEAWESGKKHEFHFRRDGRQQVLFEAKAYLNHNIHLRLNQKFALALNVEYGRLKGWLHSGAEAAEELNDQEAAKYFGTHVQLGVATVPLLGAFEPKPTTPETNALEQLELLNLG